MSPTVAESYEGGLKVKQITITRTHISLRIRNESRDTGFHSKSLKFSNDGLPERF